MLRNTASVIVSRYSPKVCRQVVVQEEVARSSASKGLSALTGRRADATDLASRLYRLHQRVLVGEHFEAQAVGMRCPRCLRRLDQ